MSGFLMAENTPYPITSSTFHGADAMRKARLTMPNIRKLRSEVTNRRRGTVARPKVVRLWPLGQSVLDKSSRHPPVFDTV